MIGPRTEVLTPDYVLTYSDSSSEIIVSPMMPYTTYAANFSNGNFGMPVTSPEALGMPRARLTFTQFHCILPFTRGFAMPMTD
jgi:hypothetical protein